MAELGFNLRGIVHYGLPNPVQRIQFSQASHVDDTLAAVQDCGGTIVRVYVGNSNIDRFEAAARLGQFLDKAQQDHGIRVIASLLDYYWPRGEGSWFTPQNIRQYYTIPIPPPSQVAEPWGDLLNEEFFNTGYQQDYLQFVDTVVGNNANHPGLYAWEAGNELQSNAITPFLATVVGRIKQLSPRPVAAGVLNASHAVGVDPSTAAAQLYNAVPMIDHATVHYYPEQDVRDRHLPDVQWAAPNGRHPIVEEMGFEKLETRRDRLAAELSFWRGEGAEAILIWGFAVQRDGDDELITPSSPDFQALRDVFRTFAGI